MELQPRRPIEAEKLSWLVDYTTGASVGEQMFFFRTTVIGCMMFGTFDISVRIFSPRHAGIRQPVNDKQILNAVPHNDLLDNVVDRHEIVNFCLSLFVTSFVMAA